MSDLSKYFELSEKDNCVFFMGDKAECFIPQRFVDREFLIIDSQVSVLAAFSILVNDSVFGGILFPAMFTMAPVSINLETRGENQYYVARLTKGCQFVTNLDIVQIQRTGYDFWLEFVSTAHRPEFIDYNDSCFMFDDLKEFTGKSIKVNHVIMEIIMAHLNRDPKNLTVPYRLTSMKEPPEAITLRDIGHGTTSTHSRIIGAYADIGRTAALLNHSDQNNELEDYFRM